MPDKVALKKKRSLRKRSCLASGWVMMGSSHAGFMHIHGSVRQSAHLQKSVPSILKSEFHIHPSGRDISFSLESHYLGLSTWSIREACCNLYAFQIWPGDMEQKVICLSCQEKEKEAEKWLVCRESWPPLFCATNRKQSQIRVCVWMLACKGRMLE